MTLGEIGVKVRGIPGGVRLGVLLMAAGMMVIVAAFVVGIGLGRSARDYFANSKAV